MKSQVEDDIDDDPIKLFDPEHDRVYFGCHLLQNGDRSITKYCQEDVTCKSDAELSENSDVFVEDFTECIPVCVKLVDCKKFPWYYKKYTQQIIEKTKFYDVLSDSDNEAELISDSNDENLKQTSIETTSNYPLITWAERNSRTRIERRLETMQLRENIELHVALQSRNNNKIDFKRNTGLVGMTITQKNMKTVEQKSVTHKTIKSKGKLVKRKKMLVDPFYLRTAHKILRGIGTEIIPVATDIENNTATNATDSTNDDTKEANNKIPVQFSLEKISKHLLNRITICNKRRDSFHNDEFKNNECNNFYNSCKDINVEYSKTSTVLNKDKNASSHVKNIKKTNKFKYNQIKAIEKLVLGLQNSEIEKGKQYKSTIKVDQIDQSPTKSVEHEVREPNSPILPCSSLIKKQRDTSEIFKKNKPNDCSQPISKPKNITDLNPFENINKPSIQANGINTINTKLYKDSKQDLLKNSPKLQDIISDVVEKQFNEDGIGAKELKKENGCDKFQTKPKASENNNIQTISKGEPINCSICIVSIKNSSTQNKSTGYTNHNNINRNIVTTSVNTCQNKPKTTVSDVDRFTHLINTLNKDTPKSINNSNNLANTNSYASAILLRPNPQPDSRIPLRFSQPGFEPRVPNFIQPQLHPNPYFANFQTPHTQPPPQPPLYSHCGSEQRLNPRSANCAVPNYRFPPPHMLTQYDNRYQTSYYPTPFQTMNNNSQESNTFPKKGMRKQIYLGTGPPTSQGSLSATFGFPPQPKSIPQKNSIPQINNITQINNIPQINNNSHINNNPQINNYHTMNNIPQKSNPQIYNNHNMNNIPQISNIPQLNNVSSDKRTAVGSKGNLVQKMKTDSSSIKSEGISSKNSSKINACKRNKELSDKIDLIERKAMMLEVLNRATDKSKIYYENGSNKIVEEVGNAFKRPRLENKAPIDDQKQVELSKGYSAPILPIPTYEKLMVDKMIVDIPKQDVNSDKKTTSGKQKNERPNSRIEKIKPQGSMRKDDTKKISLEEYKKRTFKLQGKCDNYNKKVSRKLNDNENKWMALQDKNRGNVDRFSTESDLGYDSDSTVIL